MVKNKINTLKYHEDHVDARVHIFAIIALGTGRGS